MQLLTIIVPVLITSICEAYRVSIIDGGSRNISERHEVFWVNTFLEVI